MSYCTGAVRLRTRVHVYKQRTFRVVACELIRDSVRLTDRRHRTQIWAQSANKSWASNRVAGGPRARALHSPHAVTEEGKTRRAQKITSIRERAADVAKKSSLPPFSGRRRPAGASDVILGHLAATGGRIRDP